MPKAKKLPSGSWRCQVYLGKDDNGKNIYRSVTADTKKEAEYLAAELQLKRKEKEKRGLTLREAYQRYIAAKENVLSPNTIREYDKASRRDLQELMDLYINELTQEQIQLAINHYAVSHAPKSVHNAHGLLSAVLKMYRPDFALHTRLPQKKRYDRHIPTEEDVRKLIAVTEGKRIQVPILLAAFGSLRREEVAALTPSDVTDRGVWVKKAIAIDKNRNAVVKPPKTGKSYRFVELDGWIIERVKKWCFHISLNCITNEFADAVEAAQIEHIRFHDLRHFHASEQHSLGVPDKYIMERGGWSSLSVLHDVYQHAMKDKQDEFTKRTLEYFKKFDPDKPDQG